MVYSHTKCLYYIHLNQKLNLQKQQPQGQLTSYLIYKIMQAQKLLFAFLLLSSWSTFCSSESFSDFLIDLSALYQFILYIIYICNYFRGNFSFFFFSSNPVITYCLLTKVKAQCTFLDLPCLYLFYFAQCCLLKRLDLNYVHLGVTYFPTSLLIQILYLLILGRDHAS